MPRTAGSSATTGSSPMLSVTRQFLAVRKKGPDPVASLRGTVPRGQLGLFFSEADGLFGRRVRDSHERYANLGSVAYRRPEAGRRPHWRSTDTARRCPAAGLIPPLDLLVSGHEGQAEAW